jgi:2-polyprenyl-3-methyl-5-hydroxy-6-metoxy-1,4-benzoquinol methylase
MTQDREHYLEILRSNVGFTDPTLWVEYARRHGFQRVRAAQLQRCPDCGASDSEKIGQYVYYSTLMALRLCESCGLAYSDTRLDNEVVAQHYEEAYKSDEYFRERRHIYGHLVGLVARYAPHGGSVLDIGGATGDFMAEVQRRRPDLAILVNDRSQTACAWATSRYGFRTVCGTIPRLRRIKEQFDVVILNDVLYYEPDLSQTWSVLSQLTMPNGTIIIRVPNRLRLIRLAEALASLVRRERTRQLADRIRFFNPESLFVFSQSLLRRRLRETGFGWVRAVPSPFLTFRGVRGTLGSLYYVVCKILYVLSFGRFILTPSFVVIGRRCGTSDMDTLTANRGGV